MRLFAALPHLFAAVTVLLVYARMYVRLEGEVAAVAVQGFLLVLEDRWRDQMDYQVVMASVLA